MVQYEAGAHLSLKDDVTRGLEKIGAKLLGLEGQFGKLQTHLSGIGSGLAKIGAAAGMAALVVDTLKANAALEKQVNIFKLAGNSAADAAAMKKAAFDTAVKVRGVGSEESARLYRELAGALQDNPGAIGVLPDFARAKAVMSFATGRDNEEDTKRLAKMIELRGGAINRETEKIDPQLFAGELNAAVKAIVAGQGLITTNDLQQMIKQGGPSLKNYMGNPQAFWRDYLAMAEDMNGPRAGTAVTAIARQVLGGIMTQPVAREWENLGMLNREGQGWHHDKKGNVIISDPKLAIHGFADFQKEGVKGFVDKDVRPAFLAHGYLTPEQQNAEMYKFGSTETARRAYSLYLSNNPQIEAVAQRYDNTMGTEGKEKVVDKDFISNLEAIGTAFHTLGTALGDAAGVAPVLGSIADGINHLAEKASEYPEIGKAVTWGGGAAAMGVGGWGAFKIGKSVMTGFGLPAAAAQLTGAATALDAAAVKLAGGSVVGGAAQAVGGGAVAAAEMGTMAALRTAGLIFLPAVIATGLAAGRQQPEEIVKMRQELAELNKTKFRISARIGGMGEDYVTQGPGNEAGALAFKSSQIDARIKQLQDALAAGAGDAGQAASKALAAGFDVNGFKTIGGNAANLTTGGFLGAPFAAAGREAGASLLSGFSAAAGKVAIPKGVVPAAPPAADEKHSELTLRRDRYQIAAAYRPVAAPPRKQPDVVIHNKHYLDGKMITASVTRHMAHEARYPTATGGMDTYGTWRPPGTTLTDAA